LIAIIDYGLGNKLAFENVYKRLGISVMVARAPEDLSRATKLLLPGVGAFDHAMMLFERSGLRKPVEEMVLGRGVPVIGVCVGMQMLAASSDEGELRGLGWVPGAVRKFDELTLPHATHLPHMGWNEVQSTRGSSLFRDLESDARFYFLHSYYFEPAFEDSVIAVADYGNSFACAVNHKNVYGVQFHPEKSHHFGAQLLKNFAEL
jgi:imidazole glycerol-phosphate synthase subunit HisH